MLACSLMSLKELGGRFDRALVSCNSRGPPNSGADSIGCWAACTVSLASNAAVRSPL